MREANRGHVVLLSGSTLRWISTPIQSPSGRRGSDRAVAATGCVKYALQHGCNSLDGGKKRKAFRE
jgi:hypothetical protein